jgi:hypothetical protein
MMLFPSLAPGMARENCDDPAPLARATVDRTAPKTGLVAAIAVFSREPTDQEISRARVFGEPLVPSVAATTVQENKDLGVALSLYLRRGDPEDTTPLIAFLAGHPRSAWRASLLASMGTVYRRTGRYSRALVAWEEAWQLSKGQSGLGHALADRVVGELAALSAGLGRCGRLEALLEEIEGRDVRGAAQERIAGARQSLWVMLHKPEDAFRCGPLALERIVAHRRPAQQPGRHPLDLRATGSTPLGTSLVHLRDLAAALGLGMQMARRAQGAAVLVPAVVHWETGPFAALLEERDGRYLVHDPSFAAETWLSRRVLDEEGSGYFLVREGPLPDGWRPVEPHEGERIWYPHPSAFTGTRRPPSP